MLEMSPHEVVTIDEDESMANCSSPSGSPRSGRVLYCRKCEGHGEKVILKNHAPSCPYILCTCRSCERLNQKRLKSFNKRNKDKLELAAILTEQRRKEREKEDYDIQAPSRKLSSCSSNSSTMDSDQGSTRTGLEGRSMSLGAMTVMSYDIWKAKCAAEKKRLEAEGKAPLSPTALERADGTLSPMRKRAHTFMAPSENKELPRVQPPHVKQKKGRYILLPTIPAMRIFVDEEMEKTMENETMDDAPLHPNNNHLVESQVMEMKINSPLAVQSSHVAHIPHISAPTPVTLQQNFLQTSVPMTLSMAPPVVSMPISHPGISHPVQPQPISFPPVQPPVTTAAAGPMLSAEQLVLLQNNILQQQNQALQQLINLLPMHNPTPPTTVPSPDLFSILKCQQLGMVPKQLDQVPQDLLQNLLQPRQQAIFSHSM